jgi:hypothetical protein
MKNSTLLPVVVAAVIMLVIGTSLGSVYFPVTKLVTTTEETTDTITTTAKSTTDIPVTLITTALVYTTVSGCPNNYPNGADTSHVISIQENSTAYICVRYYYYNLNSTMSLNTLSIFGLDAYNFNPASNFTISAFPNEISLGGPQALNEGASVLYSIHTNSNSSGTYNLGIEADIYPSFIICNGLFKS